MRLVSPLWHASCSRRNNEIMTFTGEVLECSIRFRSHLLQMLKKFEFSNGTGIRVTSLKPVISSSNLKPIRRLSKSVPARMAS